MDEYTTEHVLRMRTFLCIHNNQLLKKLQPSTLAPYSHYFLIPLTFRHLKFLTWKEMCMDRVVEEAQQSNVNWEERNATPWEKILNHNFYSRNVCENIKKLLPDHNVFCVWWGDMKSGFIMYIDG